MAIVYQHIDIEKNQVFYVGIGKNIARAYSKHGRGKFWKDYTKNKEWKAEILLDSISWQEACEREKQLISEYGRRDLGLGTLVNQTDGGDGTVNPSQEARRKNGEAHKGMIAWSRGLTKETDERLAKASEKLKNRTRSEEHAKKISEAKKGKPNPMVKGDKNPSKRPEVKEKIRVSQLGNKYRVGTKHESSTIDAIREMAKNREKKQCEYCSKTIDVSNYHRWHGEKCKQNK